MKSETAKKIAVCYEMIGGRAPSEHVAGALIDVLCQYTDKQVSDALERCMREVRGFLSPSDIISRIDDDRPSPNEAWALVPKSESNSTVWTSETSRAFNACKMLIGNDDIAARMTFLESYKKEVAASISRGDSVEWHYSPGFDKTGRAQALAVAYEKKLLPVDKILNALPCNEAGDMLRQKIERLLQMLPIDDNDRTCVSNSFVGQLASKMDVNNIQ